MLSWCWGAGVLACWRAGGSVLWVLQFMCSHLPLVPPYLGGCGSVGQTSPKVVCFVAGTAAMRPTSWSGRCLRNRSRSGSRVARAVAKATRCTFGTKSWKGVAQQTHHHQKAQGRR